MFIPASARRRSTSRCNRTPRYVTVVTIGVTAVGILSGLVPSASAEPNAAPLMIDVVGDTSTVDRGVELDPTLQALSRVADDNPDLTMDVSVAAAPGALTTDYFFGQPSEDGQSVVNAPQHDQIRPNAQVVLVRFGGNDAELSHVLGLVKEANSTERGGLDVRMKSLEGLLDLSVTDETYLGQAMTTAPTLTSRMLQVLAGITQRAPEAKVVVANYPVMVDAQDPRALERVDSRDLATVQKVNYDLNESIARAVRICQCADLVDVSEAVAGYEAYTDESAFSDENPAQPSDKGAALVASPLAADLAGVLGAKAPAATETMIDTPSNIVTRAGVSDVDGDSVSDSEDSAPTVANSDAPAPAPAPEDPGPVDQGLPPNTKPGREDTEAETDSDDDGDQDAAVLSADTPAVVSAEAPSVVSAESPAESGEDGSLAGGLTAQDVAGTLQTSGDLGGLSSLASFSSGGVTPANGTSSKSSSKSTSKSSGKTSTSSKSRAAQTPPVPTRNPDKGDDLGEVPLPQFTIPSMFGDEESRAIAFTQLDFTNWAQQNMAPNDNNSVTVDTIGGVKGPKAAKGAVMQSTKVTRNDAEGTMEAEVSTRVLGGWDVGLGKWVSGEINKTFYKLGPESTKAYDAENGKLPSWGTMRPGDSITRTPPTDRAIGSEKGLGRDKGPIKANAVAYDEGPSLTYTVTKVGDHDYSITYGDSASSTKRTAGSLKGVVGATVAGTEVESNRTEVMYSVRTPEQLAKMTEVTNGLDQGKEPTLAPGQVFNSISENRVDTSISGWGSKSGKRGTSPKKGVDPTAWASLEAELGVTGYRNGETVTKTTLMRSVDGTVKNAEPIGAYSITTTRLNTGMPIGEQSWLPNSFPQYSQVKSFYDGPVHFNTITFNALGQKFTLQDGEAMQRAMEMAVNDPETVQNNAVLSDLARGVNIDTALKGIGPKTISLALTALVTPPVPEHNPFMSPIPEKSPILSPPVPEHNPFNTPPMPERKAELGDWDTIPGQGLLSGEPPIDSPEMLGYTDPDFDGYSVPGVDVGTAQEGVPGTPSDLGVTDGITGYSVPSDDGVPGTISDLGASDGISGYSVPSGDGVPGTASDVSTGYGTASSESASDGISGYSVPSGDGVPGTASDVSGGYGTSASDGVSSPASDGVSGYSVPSGDGVPGTASDVGDSSSYSSSGSEMSSVPGISVSSTDTDTSSYGGESSTPGYGGDTTSYGGDTSGYGGDSSASSYGGDSSSTSYGGDSSSSYGGGDSSTSSYGGDSSSTSYGGSSTSYGGGSTSSDSGSSASGDGGSSSSSGGDSGSSSSGGDGGSSSSSTGGDSGGGW